MKVGAFLQGSDGTLVVRVDEQVGIPEVQRFKEVY